MPALQRPAHLAHRAPSAIAAALAGGLGVAQPPRISLKDDRFTLLMPNGEHHPQVPPALSINVIVVGGNPGPSRIYYDATYDAADAAAPICWSDNGFKIVDGVAVADTAKQGPSISAATPQSPLCDTCPQAVWGSKISPNGSKIPACSSVKKLAVLVAGAGDMVFLLQVPPGSLKVWRAFLAYLDTLGASADEVVIRVSIADKTLNFEAVDFLDEPTFLFAEKIVNSLAWESVVGMKDKPREGFALSAPAAQPALGFTQGVTAQVAPVGFSATVTPHVASTVMPVETDEQREAREYAEWKAAKARFDNQPARMVVDPREAAEMGAPPPKRTRGPNKARETVVPPGPIAAGTFAQPQTNGFIGSAPAPTPAGFGMAPPQNAGAGIADAIAKAFNLPT